jgi:hypothetical protein
VVRTMVEMRRILATGEPPGLQSVGAKCRACGYQPVCWDDEADVDTDRLGGASGTLLDAEVEVERSAGRECVEQLL